MATSVTRKTRKPADKEPVVIYRGIKIPPIPGKRSALSKKIRDALLSQYGTSGDEPTRS